MLSYLSGLAQSAWTGFKGLPWGNIGAGALGISSALGGNLLSYSTDKKLMGQQYEYNLALQKQAQEWAEYAYKHYHSWNTESLRSAGLNPMLSATGGSSFGSTGSTVSIPHSSMSLGNPLDTIEKYQAINQRAEAHEVSIAQSEANLAKTAAEIGLIQSNIDNINSATAGNILENTWRSSKHWREFRYGKELRELYPNSNLENILSPFLRPLHSTIVDFTNGNSAQSVNSPIVIKKGSKFTNYKYKYHNTK